MLLVHVCTRKRPPLSGLGAALHCSHMVAADKTLTADVAVAEASHCHHGFPPQVNLVKSASTFAVVSAISP